MADTLFGEIPAIVVSRDQQSSREPLNCCERPGAFLPSSETELFPDWSNDYSGEEKNEGLFTTQCDGVSFSMKVKSDCDKSSEEICFSERWRQILCGDLTSPIKSKVEKIKLVVLSNGSDSEQERYRLMTSVVPKLAYFAHGKRMAFEVVDLKSMAFSSDPNQMMEDFEQANSSDIIMQHINENNEENIAPVFAIFLGNTMETVNCPPTTINVEEMATITNQLNNNNVKPILQNDFELFTDSIVEPQNLNTKHDSGHERLLNEFYRLDVNSGPKVYKLKPITIKTKDEKKLMKELRRKINMHTKLASIVLKNYIAGSMHKVPLLSFNSFWKQIERAVLNCENPHLSCLWFRRMITDINENLDDESIGKFIPVIPGLMRIKKDEHEVVNHVANFLSNKLGFANTKSYGITWKSMTNLLKGQTALINGTKTSYIEKLCFDIYYSITQMTERKLDQNIEGQHISIMLHCLETNCHDILLELFAVVLALPESGKNLKFSALDKQQLVIGQQDREILQHIKFAHELHNRNVTNGVLINEIQAFITHKEKSYLFVTGPVGSGKSTLLASAALSIQHRFDNGTHTPLVFYRSKGLTGKSTMEKIMTSFCYQLHFMLLEHHKKDNNENHPGEKFDWEAFENKNFKTLQINIAAEFLNLIHLCEKELNNRLVFIIDNLDIESDLKQWLPKASALPKNTKLLLSLKSHSLSNITQRKDFEECVQLFKPLLAKIPQLQSHKAYCATYKSTRKSIAITDNLIKSFLKKRNVTPEQLEVLSHAISHCPFPIIIALCCEIAKTWTSFSTSAEILKIIPETGFGINDFVKHFLTLLEFEFDTNFVESSLGFIAISKNGISHYEMLELLARDNTLLSKFAGIKNSAKLIGKNNSGKDPSNRRCDNVCEITEKWYHLFSKMKILLIETFADEVLTLKLMHDVYEHNILSRLSKEKYKSLCKTLFLYFNNTPTLCSRCNVQHPCFQPLVWKNDSHTNDEVLNLRRLSESLPAALKCGHITMIQREMLFSFEWLRVKLKGYSLKEVMEDIKKVLIIEPKNKDLQILSSTLFLSSKVLDEDCTQLASQLVGRLYSIVKSDRPSTIYDPRTYPLTRKLYKEVKKCKSPNLVPSTGCLDTSHRIMYDTLNGHTSFITALTASTDGWKIITAAKDNTIKVWDLIERKVTNTIRNTGRDIVKLATCMGNFYIVSMNTESKIAIWNIRNGSCELSIPPCHKDDKTSFTISREGQLLVVFSSMKGVMAVWDLDKFKNIRDIEIMKYNYDPSWVLTVSDKTRGSNVFYGFIDRKDAMIVNCKRGKYLQNIKCQHGFITNLSASREYYIIASKSRNMHVHEIQCFNFYDVTNYGFIRTIQACPDDKIVNVFVNMLGSHMIGINKPTTDSSEIVVWSVDHNDHQHIMQINTNCQLGTCIDLQYCVVASKNEIFPRIYNLAAKIDADTHSRTHVKSRTDGVRDLFPIKANDKYVVARGFDNGPISIWDVSKEKRKGESVIIERGLLEQTDLVIVKDHVMVVLSDRSLSSENDALQVFETMYIYNLLLKKYERKLTPVAIHPCPVNEYLILGGCQLLAPSSDRTCFVIWSLTSGKIVSRLFHDFSVYEKVEQEQEQLSLASYRNRKKKQRVFSLPNPETSKYKTTWRPCHLTPEERTKQIYKILISEDEKTLICSYFTRHLAVFNLEQKSHTSTLTDKSSIMQLDKCSKITKSGKFFIHTNHDSEKKKSYISLWCLTSGSILRRLCNEPYAQALAVSDSGDRIVYLTKSNTLRVWDPYRRKSLKSINDNQQQSSQNHAKDDLVELYILNNGEHAVIVNQVISLWDLETLSPISRFSLDSKIYCCTLALDEQFVVFGMKGHSDIITLKLPFASTMELDSTSSEEDR